MSDNAAHLRRRLHERLLEEAPGSVLDVGCGRGDSLALLRAAGVRSVGLEASAARAGTARARGSDVVRASAERLPFARRSFDWVLVRHVLHHLVHPERAVHEAARVARFGLALAEPWRDLELPAQATARALDRWSKARERERGIPHGDDLSAATLASMLPRGEAWRLETQCHLVPATRPLAEVRDELAPLTDGLAEGAPARGELAELLARAEATGVGLTGTTILVARRSG